MIQPELVTAIVLQIRAAKAQVTDYLSTSTRGIVSEVCGMITAVKQTVRGLTLVTTGGKVVWHLSPAITKAVMMAV